MNTVETITARLDRRLRTIELERGSQIARIELRQARRDLSRLAELAARGADGAEDALGVYRKAVDDWDW